MTEKNIADLGVDTEVEEIEQLLDDQEQAQNEPEFEDDIEIDVDEPQSMESDVVVRMATGLYIQAMDMFFARSNMRPINKEERGFIEPLMKDFVDQMPDVPVSGPVAAGIALGAGTLMIYKEKQNQLQRDNEASEASRSGG